MDQVANHFVNYLFDQYQGSRHVRRVASWIGMILKGIERAGAANIRFHRSRQLTFEYKGQKFKARYNHSIPSRGGIEILEVLSGRGTPDGNLVYRAGNLKDAEDIYLNLSRFLDKTIDN